MSDERTQTLPQGERKKDTSSPSRPGLLLLHAPDGQAPRCITLARETTLGRQPDQTIFVADGALSRSHAKLSVQRKAMHVEDLGSHNGTFVDGVELERGRSAALAPGQVLRCGDTVLMAVVDVEPYAQWPASFSTGPLLGGPSMAQVRLQIELSSASGLAVLLHGESGTGKEVAARLLHGVSGRPGEFIPVNCAAVPPALFEAELFGSVRGAFTGASGDRAGLIVASARGTLFLDEIGELPVEVQPKLLRAVELGEVRPVGAQQAREVQLHLVAASHRRLDAEVAAGRFREDLYHRVRGVQIEIPPLRERRDDAWLFARRCLEQLRRSDGGAWALEGGFVEKVLLERWSGNVRQLEHAVREATIHAALEGAERLAPHHLRGTSEGVAKVQLGQEQEIDRVVAALRRCKGNVVAAAQNLGMARSRLYSLLRQGGLRAADFRQD